MKKYIITGFISIIIIISLFVFLVNKSINKIQNEYKELLNKEIVFKKDTLLIIDYSIFNENVLLSNNKEMNFNLAKQLIIKK